MPPKIGTRIKIRVDWVMRWYIDDDDCLNTIQDSEERTTFLDIGSIGTIIQHRNRYPVDNTVEVEWDEGPTCWIKFSWNDACQFKILEELARIADAS